MAGLCQEVCTLALVPCFGECVFVMRDTPQMCVGGWGWGRRRANAHDPLDRAVEWFYFHVDVRVCKFPGTHSDARRGGRWGDRDHRSSYRGSRRAYSRRPCRPRCLAGRERRREQTQSPSVCTTSRAFQCAGTCQRDTNATTMMAPRSLRGTRCTRARSCTLFGRCFSPSGRPPRCSVSAP